MTIFGISSCLSGPVLTTSDTSQTLATLSQTPQVVFWVWIHLLFFNIQNHGQPGAAEEDDLNKPWRPIPSGRLTSTDAKYLLLALYIIVPVLGLSKHTLPQSLGLILFGSMYNLFGGADKNFFIRNLLNATGISCFCSGATIIASTGTHVSLNSTAYMWFLVIAIVIFTTMQVQDMEDQAGDGQRQRYTLPLVLGDGPARWTIAVPVVFWSFVCPFFFDLGAIGFVVPVLAGTVVAFRTVTVRTLVGDKQSFRIWNLWMVILFLLPCVKSLGKSRGF
ncbi:hypothetical protein MMC28_006853 [Mycoblastus sanguinarius]|nr:hypothetical protein [Mycoblastus sanguinarius]